MYLHEFSKPVDMSKEADKPKGTVLVTYVIKGLEQDVFMVEDHGENSFFFMVQVAENVPLFVPLADENVYEKCVEFVVDQLTKDK